MEWLFAIADMNAIYHFITKREFVVKFLMIVRQLRPTGGILVLPAEAYFLSKNVDIPILSKIRSITLERRVRYVHEFTLPWFWHSRLSA